MLTVFTAHVVRPVLANQKSLSEYGPLLTSPELIRACLIARREGLDQPVSYCNVGGKQ